MRKTMQELLEYYKKIIEVGNNVYKRGRWGQFVGGRQAFDCICIIKACSWDVPINIDITANQYSYIANNKADMPDTTIANFYAKAAEKDTNINTIPKNKLSFVYLNDEHIGLYNPAENLVYECVGGSQQRVAAHPLDYYANTKFMWNKWSSGGYFIDSFVEEETLQPENTEPTEDTSNAVGKYYRVQAGSFKIKQNAINRANEIKNKGFDVIIKKYNQYYRVQTGAYEVREHAENKLAKVKSAGYQDAFITQRDGEYVAF